MSISKPLLQKYAELIVRTGANVQPGQVVQLTVSVEQSAFAALIMEECYRAGASKVNVEWTFDVQRRLNFLYADQVTLSRVLPWEEAKMKQMVEDLPCRIYIASEDPDAMNGIDPQKLSAVMQARGKVVKPYRNAIDGRHQWVIAAYPSEKWAKKCFPEAEDAIEYHKELALLPKDHISIPGRIYPPIPIPAGEPVPQPPLAYQLEKEAPVEAMRQELMDILAESGK